VQLTELMSTTAAGDADKAAKASLFIRLVEVRAFAACYCSIAANSANVTLRTVADMPALFQLLPKIVARTCCQVSSRIGM